LRITKENTSEETKIIEIALSNMLRVQTSAALVGTVPEIIILKSIILDL